MDSWNEFYDPSFYEGEIGPGDRVADTYVTVIGARATTCLDLGCGTGNVSLKLALAGHNVTGLDSSAKMLETASLIASRSGAEVNGRLQYLHGDIRTFALDRCYEFILLPNELVLHLLTQDELIQTLTNCHQHATESGRVILDIPRYDVRLLAAAASPQTPLRHVHGFYPIESGGRSISVEEDLTYDESSMTLIKLFRYEELDEQGVSVRTFRRRLIQRPWTLDEVMLSMRVAGFEGVHAAAAVSERVLVIGQA